MLPEIIISSNVKGIIKINGSMLGEISKSDYQSFVGANSFLLGYTPFTHKKVYAPITAKITIKNGLPQFDCPYIKMFNHKGSVYLLEIEPPCLAMHTLPVCLEYKTLEERFIISLVEQNSFYMVVEDEQKKLADGFFPLLLNEKPFLKTAFLGEDPFIIVGDNSSKLYIFNKSKNGFSQHLCLEADSFELENDEIIVSKTTAAGHIVKNTYVNNGVSLYLSKTEYNENPLPYENIVEDFLECIKFGIEERALALLAPELRIEFFELREFLGDFTEFKKSPFNENAYALIGQKSGDSFLVNRFEFEIENEKILNIKEL